MMNLDMDLAYQDLYDVIPELRDESMNRTYPSSISDYGYHYDPSTMLQRNESMGMGSQTSLYDSPVYNPNFSEWVKASIMGDQLYDYVPDLPCNTRPSQGDQLLMYKTQQIAQSRGSFDDCRCSSYSSDVPYCTCDVQTEQLKPSLEPEMTMQSIKATQDAWLREQLNESTRIQREQFYQSLAVPDPSQEYPYYHDESSIYEQEVPQPLPLLNSIPEKSPPLSTCQLVPISAEYNVPSPIPPKPGKTSRPRLCHFLLELLRNPQQYSDIVEWVDKEKGVFKFLNSAEVASQWGRRRNKPNMKYENFARSLRTYIAKGILTKPRSKLVYRFTSKVY